jgi:curved DNA-binding protein CbpA
MEATDEEILGLSRNPTLAELKRAKREAAKTYHTDRHQQLESGDRFILDLRLKEANAAADRVEARLQPEGKQRRP